MREIKINIAHFERDRLPELLQGAIAYEQSVSISRLSNEKLMASGLIAVWSHAEDYLNPLPHFIVGSRSALSDLCAWSKAFMKDVGPLSGIIRLVEPSQIKALFKVKDTKFPNDLDIVSRQISLILAEVIARSSSGNVPERIELRACLNTVSFAIFLAENRGLQIEPKEVASRWAKVRGLVQRNEQNRITESVMALYPTVRQNSGLSIEQVDDFRPEHVKKIEFNPELPLQTDNFHGEFLRQLIEDPEFNRKPKEDLVRVIDHLIPKLIQNRMNGPFDYLPFAKLIAQTTSGLANQLALLGKSASEFPELILILGVLQGSSPPPDILSSYNAVGWKLLSRLTERLDPFKRPDCDISFEESYIYSGLGNNAKMLAGNRLRVEIAWGISTEVTTIRPGGNNISSSKNSSQNGIPHTEIVPVINSIERRLMDVMDMLRHLRDQKK